MSDANLAKNGNKMSATAAINSSMHEQKILPKKTVWKNGLIAEKSRNWTLFY